MERRNFIRNSSLAGIAIASVGVASCNNPVDKKETGEIEKNLRWYLVILF